MGKIVTLGEVVADVYRKEISSKVEMPFTARPGGAPANVAVAAAKLGAEAAFVGSLGDDLFGEFIRNHVEERRAVRELVNLGYAGFGGAA